MSRPKSGESNYLIITQHVDETDTSYLHVTAMRPTHIYYAVGMLQEAINALLELESEWVSSDLEDEDVEELED